MTSDQITTVSSILASTALIISFLKVSINQAKEELKAHVTDTMLNHIRLEHLPKTETK